MATSLAIAVLATKKYRGQAIARSIAERTQCAVVPLTTPEPDVLSRCCTVLIESDLNIEHQMELIHTIKMQNPDAAVVVLGSAESPEDIARLAEAGACGYLPANADFEEMLAISKSAVKGEFICPPQTSHQLCRQLAALAQRRELCVLQEAGLTTRERQVLGLLRDSVGKREIADRLCVSECTVKSHVHRVRQKLSNSGPLARISA
jgi:DNA-binding NarL/FixJ family response regulator